ncbi:hypothetical protein PAEPH01_0719 [Pancytospora epiphaga]|nr:hypothetical protein PAEPH01_0719 [Pancytospora epiphaga]
MVRDPSDMLKAYLHEQIIVRLGTGEFYVGVLNAFDEHSNLFITTGSESLFIRGENIVFAGQQK